jgi:hypothetical protein
MPPAWPSHLLPDNYIQVGSIDLSKDRRLVVILNGVGLALFLLSAWLSLMLATSVRPADAAVIFQYKTSTLGYLGILLAWILGLTGLMLVLHEGIHGIFFWIFTRSRPRFGFRGYYAFAAAPDWFIPYHQYLVVALSPLALMSLLGIGLVWVIPTGYLGPLIFLIAMNFSGSVGDMLVAAWLIFKPSTFLAQDYGDGVRFYGPKINPG